MITYNISHLIYMILIWLSILTSSKLLLLRATWKREKEFRNLSLNVGAVKILQNNFYFLLGNMRLFVRKAFDILYWAVCHIFQCDIFCQREMRFCAFCHLLFYFSMIPLLCPHPLLFHYSKSLQAIFLYPWFHFFIGTSSRFFVFCPTSAAVLNRCPDKCVTSVEKVSLWGWFFYNVLSMRKYVTSVGKIKIHFSSSQIDFI